MFPNILFVSEWITMVRVHVLKEFDRSQCFMLLYVKTLTQLRTFIQNEWMKIIKKPLLWYFDVIDIVILLLQQGNTLKQLHFQSNLSKTYYLNLLSEPKGDGAASSFMFCWWHMEGSICPLPGSNTEMFRDDMASSADATGSTSSQLFLSMQSDSCDQQGQHFSSRFCSTLSMRYSCQCRYVSQWMKKRKKLCKYSKTHAL